MNELKTLIKNNIKEYTMIIVLVLITIFFEITTKGILLVPQNLSNLVLQNAYVVILAVGMMLCILTGGNIDLSVGSVVAFIGALCGVLIIEQGVNIYLVIGLSILISLFVGIWHGFWIAKFKVPSFIATLSGMLIFRGLTYVLLNGKTYSPYPDSFLNLTTGFLPDIIGGGHSKVNLFTVAIGLIASVVFILLEISKRKQKMKYGFKQVSKKFFITKLLIIAVVINAFMYTVALYKGMPVVLIPVAIIVIAYNFIAKNTILGRYIYAIGGNQKASRLSGIKVDRVLFFTYVNMAFLAAIAGIVFTARLNAGSPQAGNGFELDAIAACFIGGASATGGIGTIIGALIGALVMGILNNGMSIMGIDVDLQMVIKGLVLLLAVVLDMAQKNKSRN